MKYLAVILLSLLMPLQAFAAIAFDAANSVGDGSFSSRSVTLTVSSSANRVVFACVEGTTQSTDRITSVTYLMGGVATNMTLASHSKGAGARWTSLWYGIAPDSGSNTITANSNPADIIGVAVASYTGVNQSMKYVPTATDATSSNSVTSGIASGSVTTISDNSWVLMCAHGTTLSGGQAGTLRVANVNGYGIVDSNSAKTPPGSVTVSSNPSSNWTIEIASFSPAASVSSFLLPPLLQLIIGWW